MQITSLFPRGPGPRSRDDDAVADVPAVAKVQVLNQQSIAAARTNDAEWFSRNLADDAVVLLGGGQRLRKPEFLEMLRNEPKLYRSLVVQDVTVRAFGSMMQVDAVACWEMADGTSGVCRYIDTWAAWRAAGRWCPRRVTPLVE